MDGAAQGPAGSRPGGERSAAASELAISLQLITERVVLSALREQDAADAAEVARRRAEFLAEASLRFGASLDQELTYAAIAGVALPGLDAWCIVDVVEAGGGFRRLAVVHPDEDKRDTARALVGKWTPAADDPIGVPAVMNQRLPVIVTTGAEDAVSAGARDSATLRLLRRLGAGSLLIVPVVAHDLLLGAITFVSRPGAPPYSPDDVLLGQALAARCAQALESARLYAAARAAWAEADIAQADAQAARAEAETANATKADFLRTMSHELRTPLNAIGGYAQLLMMGVRGPVTPEQQTDLASIQRSQLHLLGLVDAVLDYARLEAGHMTYATADISLVAVVAGAQSLVAPQMRAKEVDYAFEAVDLPLTVRADAEKVRQIVVNLLGNATKFTPPGGRITVSCEEFARAAGAATAEGPLMFAVRVTDTGRGIPADLLESVFEPFVQVDRRLTSSDVGIGLGLAISRNLARAMRGDLTMDSTPGVGTTFTLTLPAA
ncbi:MAG: GAF domain-containing sensor histidine kinase [Gemmatimonadaceae bacterium]